MGPVYVVFYRRTAIDDALWHSVIPQLNDLRIVVEQPRKTSGYYKDASIFKQDMESWIKWLRLLLQCFGQHLSIKTTVQVNYDGSVETGAILMECLPHGFREIQCPYNGDVIFRKGVYSRNPVSLDDEAAGRESL
jgi:hypothetical protein